MPRISDQRRGFYERNQRNPGAGQGSDHGCHETGYLPRPHQRNGHQRGSAAAYVCLFGACRHGSVAHLRLYAHTRRTGACDRFSYRTHDHAYALHGRHVVFPRRHGAGRGGRKLSDAAGCAARAGDRRERHDAAAHEHDHGAQPAQKTRRGHGLGSADHPLRSRRGADLRRHGASGPRLALDIPYSGPVRGSCSCAWAHGHEERHRTSRQQPRRGLLRALGGRFRRSALRHQSALLAGSFEDSRSRGARGGRGSALPLCLKAA